MDSVAPLPSSPRLIVDLDAVRSNYRLMAERSGKAKTGAAIKADAYGLGLERIAPVLAREGCTSFFCAHLSEAVAARSALDYDAEIFVLSGVSYGEAPLLRQKHLTPVLNTHEQILLWREAGGDDPAALHIDTGINRLGLDWHNFAPAMAEGLNLSLVMSHFACASDPAHALNTKQLERFTTIRNAFPNVRASLANSAGILHGAETHFDLTRPGIALYGGAPLDTGGPSLTPVARIEAPVLQVRHLRKNQNIGYGASFTAPRDMTIATAAIGYADGVPVAASNCWFGRIEGQKTPLLGRVSMDLCVFDVGHLPSPPQPGDMLSLLGQDLEVLASLSDTLSYELLTRLGPRFVREYKGRSA